tara:strand:+ start:3807 stop:4034 length:228 start_codon:yes stop_codon:yes gene_type:complete
MLSTPSKTYKTVDLILAAFLKSKGMKLCAWVKSPNNQVTFEFNDENNEVKNLLLEYINSDERRFYNEVKGLKQLT